MLVWITGCGKKYIFVGSASMSPTINSDEVATVNLRAYSKRKPQRWDVVLFHPPPSTLVSGQSWIMRIVGLPNEVIEFKDGGIHIDGVLQPAPIHLANIRYSAVSPGNGLPASPLLYPYKIPEDTYFLCGDNTTSSFDSRYWGSLPRANILGKVEQTTTPDGAISFTSP